MLMFAAGEWRISTLWSVPVHLPVINCCSASLHQIKLKPYNRRRRTSFRGSALLHCHCFFMQFMPCRIRNWSRCWNLKRTLSHLCRWQIIWMLLFFSCVMHDVQCSAAAIGELWLSYFRSTTEQSKVASISTKLLTKPSMRRYKLRAKSSTKSFQRTNTTKIICWHNEYIYSKLEWLRPMQTYTNVVNGNYVSSVPNLNILGLVGFLISISAQLPCHANREWCSVTLVRARHKSRSFAIAYCWPTFYRSLFNFHRK